MCYPLNLSFIYVYVQCCTYTTFSPHRHGTTIEKFSVRQLVHINKCAYGLRYTYNLFVCWMLNEKYHNRITSHWWSPQMLQTTQCCTIYVCICDCMCALCLCMCTLTVAVCHCRRRCYCYYYCWRWRATINDRSDGSTPPMRGRG